MRVDEVTRLEGKNLFESIDSSNSTGVATADLVNIVEAHRSNKWQRFETNESFDEFLNNLEKM